MKRFEELIDTALLPLVTKRCVILDAPYYNNVGDVLIYEGMEQFIAKHGIQCLYRSSNETFEYRLLDEDVCVFLVGGGNFGDLWRGLQEFRNRIISLYPNNRIIVFPQSVYYDSSELLQSDAQMLSEHSNLYLCARDKQSYELLKSHFAANNILLLPDMALYVNYNVYPQSVGHGTLFLQREDKEAIPTNGFIIPEDADVTDWPMHTITRDVRTCFVQRSRWAHRVLRHLCAYIAYEPMRLWLSKLALSNVIRRIKKNDGDIRTKWIECYVEYEYLDRLNRKHNGKFNTLIDYWMNELHRPLIVRYGVAFVAEYEHVISTRLHAGMMAAMLNKQATLIDNSYGKISGVYTSWLEDMKNFQMG